MASTLEKWIELNKDAEQICGIIIDKVTSIEDRDPFVNICGAFLHKGKETLSAVNILYDNKLEEPAQSLIRILFELRINFDCFLTMAHDDVTNAVKRVADSMMLEKIKQARASGFLGMPDEMKQHLEQLERDIASGYTDAEFRSLRKNGFTGVPIEQRASMTGHDVAYSVVYRNFSRNVHSTDYVESYMKASLYDDLEDDDYIENRDVVAHYVAHFSAVGMAEFANGVFNLGLDKELDDLGQRQKLIKQEDEKFDT